MMQPIPELICSAGAGDRALQYYFKSKLNCLSWQNAGDGGEVGSKVICSVLPCFILNSSDSMTLQFIP